jgi:peptidoglycan/LPS O-acetylase OafA/YrhL
MAAYFCFLQNFSSPHPSFFPEAWSLSVEEWFYLLIPAGLFLSIQFLKLPKKWVTFTWTVSILLLVSGFRIYRSIRFGYADFESWDNFQRKVVLTRLDSIMFGFLGAWIVSYYRSIWIRIKRPAFIIGVLLLFLPAALESILVSNMTYTNYVSLTITSLGTLLLLPALSELKTGKGPVYRFLTFVSIISYSMYLVNFSLIQLSFIPSLTGMIVSITTNHLEISIIRYISYWVLTFLLAYLLYSFYEKPMMALRERFEKKRAEVVESVK